MKWYITGDDEIYVLPTAEIRDNYIYAKKFYMTRILQMLNGKRDLNTDYIKRYVEIKNSLNKLNDKYFTGNAGEVLSILSTSEKIRKFKKSHPNMVFEYPTEYMGKYNAEEPSDN